MSILTYKELKELIRDKSDEEKVILVHINQDNDYYTIEPVLLDGYLVLKEEICV